MLTNGCSSKHTAPIFCQDKRNVPFEYKHGHNIKRTIETVLHVVISYFFLLRLGRIIGCKSCSLAAGFCLSSIFAHCSAYY